MSLNVGTLLAILKLDKSGFDKPLDGAVKKIKEAGEEMRSAAMSIGVITASLAGVGAYAVKAASDFDETTNLIQTGFGSAAVGAEKWAVDTAQAMGRSTQQMRDFGGQLQVLLAPMLGSQSEAAGMSKAFAELAVDIGSFYNVADSDALLALKSGLTGELEPLKKFGIAMTENALKQYAHAKGMSTNIQAMSEAEKVMLRYSYILDHTTLVQGDAERTADSFANQLKRLRGNVDDLAVSVGGPLKEALAPFLSMMNDFVSKISPGMGELLAKMMLAATVITGAAAGFLALGGAMFGITSALPAIISGLAMFGTTVLPIIVIVATLALAAGWLYKAWKAYSTDIIAVARRLADGIKDAFVWLKDVLAKIWSTIVGVIVDALTAIPRVIMKTMISVTGMLQNTLTKMRPLLEAAGFGDLAAAGVKAFTGDLQDMARTLSGIESFGDNIKKAFTEIAFGGGDLAKLGETLHGIGLSLGEGVKFGVEGLQEFLARAFGVDLNKLKIPGLNGTDTKMTPPGGLPPKPGPGGGGFSLDVDNVKFKPRAWNTLSEAVAQALEHAVADPDWWRSATNDLAFGMADALTSALGSSYGRAIDGVMGKVADFAQGDAGKRTLTAGAAIGDQLLSGNFDLGAIGGAIGTAAAPGIGSIVGKAVGDGITKIGELIASLTSKIVDGISGFVSTLGSILLRGGQQRTGLLASSIGEGGSAGTGVAGAIAAAVALGAVLSGLAVAFVALTFSTFGMFLMLVTQLALLSSVVLAVTSPFLLLAAGAGAISGLAVALLSMSTSTESFKRFSLALEWGARAVTDALEPLFTALMPLAGVAVMLLQTFAALLGPMFALLQTLGVFEALFFVVRDVSIMIARFGLALLEAAETFVKVIKEIASAIPGVNTDALDALDDSIDEWQNTLRVLRDNLKELSMDEAAAYAETAAGLEELAQAANDAAGSLNLPEAFKLAAARAGATNDGGTLVGGEWVGENRPIVQVFVNGIDWEDMRLEDERATRIKAVAETGIPMTGTRGRNRVPRRGN